MANAREIDDHLHKEECVSSMCTCITGIIVIKIFADKETEKVYHQIRSFQKAASIHTKNSPAYVHDDGCFRMSGRFKNSAINE